MKKNVTGIKKLSIETTKNSKDGQVTRYCVNHKIGNQSIGRSFYFGLNNSQINAFNSAIEYMIDNGIYSNTIKEVLGVYKRNNHVNLYCKQLYSDPKHYQ